VYVQANRSHGIRSDANVIFNSLDELPRAVEEAVRRPLNNLARTEDVA
jgi:hypothetical protein